MPEQSYSTFNREERNYAAILYHPLLKPGGLATFLKLLGHDEMDPRSAELYFEYAYARDVGCAYGAGFGAGKKNDLRNQGYYAAIVSMLQPSEGKLLCVSDVHKFNQFFLGEETARASKNQIQMPGRWSQTMYDKWTDKAGLDFAQRACRLIWAFNVKPDLVLVEPTTNFAICVEIKVDSNEGSDSMGIGERRFPMTQKAMQRYVLEELLGYETRFVLLSPHGNIPTPQGAAPKCAAAVWGESAMRGEKWIDVFEAPMPRGSGKSCELPFVDRMIDSAILQPGKSEISAGHVPR